VQVLQQRVDRVGPRPGRPAHRVAHPHHPGSHVARQRRLPTRMLYLRRLPTARPREGGQSDGAGPHPAATFTGVALSDLHRGFRDDDQRRAASAAVMDRLVDDREQEECHSLLKFWWQLTTPNPSEPCLHTVLRAAGGGGAERDRATAPPRWR
jgi:hypothetical protein